MASLGDKISKGENKEEEWAVGATLESLDCRLSSPLEFEMTQYSTG